METSSQKNWILKMKQKILLLSLQNLFLKLRIFLICKLFPNLLNNKRSGDFKAGYELTFIDDFDHFNKSVWQDFPYFGYRYHPGNIVEKGIEPFQYFDSSYITVENSILKRMLITKLFKHKSSELHNACTHPTLQRVFGNKQKFLNWCWIHLRNTKQIIIFKCFNSISLIVNNV